MVGVEDGGLGGLSKIRKKNTGPSLKGLDWVGRHLCLVISLLFFVMLSFFRDGF